MIKLPQPAWFDALLLKKHQGDSIKLKHDTIYVSPSKSGLGFLGIAVLNFILGINYQNNLILAVSYLMFVLLLMCLIYAFSNFNGLEIEVAAIKDDFEDKRPSVTFKIENQKQRYDIQIEHIETKEKSILKRIKNNEFLDVFLPVKRGKHTLGRFKIITHYPFGLVTIWSYLISEKHVYAYPTQIETELPKDSFIISEKGEKALDDHALAEDFNELKSYREGMSIHRISWRHFAKNKELLVKDYQSPDKSASYGFDFDKVSGTKEDKLSQLSFLIVQAEIEQQSYALKLPNRLITLSQGNSHKKQCLEALSEA
jgi:uncharacterized protein (DUF58 family)